MNVLPVKPQFVRDSAERARYFHDLERLGFNTACISCRALSHDQLVGDYREVYTNFAMEAIQKGHMACIRIHATLSAGDKVGISESQRDAGDSPIANAEGFYASLASDAWMAYVKELLELFVRDYGYGCVIFEGCEFQTDIPGQSDPFAAMFASQYPALNYPTQRSETPEYLRLRKEKAKLTSGFLSEIATYAKQMGASLVGVMPYYLPPLADASADEVAKHSCEVALSANIPEVDFLVSAMSPEDILGHGVRTGDEMQNSPALLYADLMAHSSSKRTLANAGQGNVAKMGDAYLRDCTNAAIAGSPCGFNLEWQPSGIVDADYCSMMAAAAESSGRLGDPKAAIAFVFSCSGTHHVDPRGDEDVFQAYWGLAKKMAFDERLPMLTFHAETLENDLASHPEVQVLIFDEHFPLSIEQMMVIRNWWQGTQRRAAIAFGVGQAFSADPDVPGLRPSGVAYPGMLELIGLKPEDEPVVTYDEPVALSDVSRVRRSAFLGDDLSEGIKAVAGVRRVFGSRANVLYEAEHKGNRIPVVAEWRDRTTLAVFCGFGLSPDTADMAVKAIRYVLREVDAPAPIVDSYTQGVVWSINRNDYIVLSNLSDTEGSVVGRPGRANFWDCREKRMLPAGDPQLSLAPHSFRQFRMVGRRSKFFDVIGCGCLRSLTDGAGRAEIEMLAGKTTVFALRSSPKEIYVDGRPSIVTQEVVDDVYYVTLQQCPPGERKISLRW